MDVMLYPVMDVWSYVGAPDFPMFWGLGIFAYLPQVTLFK